MRNGSSNLDFAKSEPSAAPAKNQGGSQTLLRGLDVIEAVTDGPVPLAELAARLGLTRSTTHRLATALIERRYISFVPRMGYQLGAKLLDHQCSRAPAEVVIVVRRNQFHPAISSRHSAAAAPLGAANSPGDHGRPPRLTRRRACCDISGCGSRVRPTRPQASDTERAPILCL